MGKPFESELNRINDTLNWGNSVEIQFSEQDVYELLAKPTYVIGSGGSTSACHYFSLLHHYKGGFSKPVTPLELVYKGNSIKDNNVVLISASGKNSDILMAYKRALKHSPNRILGICTASNTKLSKLASTNYVSRILEYPVPAGKDGFLATNSLIAYFSLLPRLFGFKINHKKFEISKRDLISISKFVERLEDRYTLTVLYGGWSQPVAVDIESKFTEAGIGNVLLTDYRNFAHGRHNWFDKQKKVSAIVALVSPDEKQLAEKTLSLIPKMFPVLILETSSLCWDASIDLLNKSFHLVNQAGKKGGIDPGRPGVPHYGSKLYNLKYETLLPNKIELTRNDLAILKKTNRQSLTQVRNAELSYWNKSLSEFITTINKGKFGSIIFDYDGTLCTKEEKRTLPNKEIIDCLNLLLSKGFIIGVVTGRGKSVRETLQKCIAKKNWASVIVGYYNGAEIRQLDDGDAPDTTQEGSQALKDLEHKISSLSWPFEPPLLTLRPFQLTIENKNPFEWKEIKQRITESLSLSRDGKSYEIVESGHSMDIIDYPNVCKSNIVEICQEYCRDKGNSIDYVAIGDKGKFPGNDYHLLSSKCSLSVDEVSSDPLSCWNLGDLGLKGVEITLQYLKAIKFNKSHFSLRL